MANLILEAVQKATQELAGGPPPIVGILVRAEAFGAVSEAARKFYEACPSAALVYPYDIFTHPRYRKEQATVFYDRKVMREYLEKLNDPDSKDQVPDSNKSGT